MTARFSALSRTAQLALVCGALLVVAVGGWFTMVSPKRSTAADLKEQTAAVQAEIDRNRTAGFTRALPAVRAASIFSVAKAMPETVGMPDVILQLNQLALDSGITFDEISPQPATTDTAFEVEPIKVQFSGNFYNLSDFLLRLRNLVRVENGKLFARGRMFAVSGISFAEAEQKFPAVTATMTVNAFVPAAVQAPVAAGTATSTDGSTTTPAATTTTPAQSGSSAASQGGNQ